MFKKICRTSRTDRTYSRPQIRMGGQDLNHCNFLGIRVKHILSRICTSHFREATGLCGDSNIECDHVEFIVLLRELKVVGNEKEGGSRRWQMIGIGLRPRRSRFVCLIILLLSLILSISVSAPVKKNE
jgi:hypothetical protein